MARPALTPSPRAGRGRGGHGGLVLRDTGQRRGGERLAAACRRLQRHRVDPQARHPVTRPNPPPETTEPLDPTDTRARIPAAASPTDCPTPPASTRVDATISISALEPLHDSPTRSSWSRCRRPAPRHSSVPPGLARPGFTWTVEEGESGAKRRTPLPPKPRREANETPDGGAAACCAQGRTP